MKIAAIGAGIALIVTSIILLYVGMSIKIEVPQEYSENIPVSLYSYAKSMPLVADDDNIVGSYQVISPPNGTVHFSIILASREQVGEKPTYTVIYAKESSSSDSFNIKVPHHGVLEFIFTNTDETAKEVEFHYRIAGTDEQTVIWVFFLPCSIVTLVIGVVLMIIGLKPKRGAVGRERFPNYMTLQPVSQPEQQIPCPSCKTSLIFIQQYQKWYCYNCRRYL